MTDRVVAFDMTARAAGPVQATLQVAEGSVPPRHSPRAEARADLAAVYAGILGGDLAVPDVVETLVAAGADTDPDLSDLATALRRAGLRAQVYDATDVVADLWPALAEMVSGQIVLVLSQDQQGLVIYDTTFADRQATVGLQEFAEVFSGRILKLSLTLSDLETRHSDAPARKHWFWGEFSHYRRPLAEVAAGSLVANLLAVAVAMFSLQVYDRVIPYKSEPTLWVLALGAILAILFEGMLKFARASLMDMTGKRIEMSVQTRLMQRLLGMKADPGKRSPSSQFSAMREFGSVREFFTATAIGTLADLPFLIIFLLLVASIGGNIVWVLVVGGILMVLPGFLFQKRMVALTAATQGANVRATRMLYESVFEAETLTTQRGEERVRRIWDELTAVSALRSSDQRRLTSILGFWAQGVQQATYITTVVVGAYQVFAGNFTVGTIIAIGILTGRTLGPLSQLSSTLARWSNVKAALDGLEPIANAVQQEEGTRHYLRRDKINGAFELRAMEFRYDAKAAPTVEVAALAIPAGQSVAVLGANGSGKSTLLRLLAGIYDPSAGRILLDGVDMSQIHPRDLRRNLGYLGQDVRLFSGTLRDNLNLNQLERDDNRLYAALDFAGLGPYVRSHPRGLDLEIREMSEGLSVGQRQSIGWARLWLQDPAIVVLDEPTAALDSTLETTLVSRLKTWLEGRTAIIATHRVPILQLTTRTLILQNGRVMVDGPRDAVLAHLAKAPQQAGGKP